MVSRIKHHGTAYISRTFLVECLAKPTVYLYPHNREEFPDLMDFESYVISRLHFGSGVYHHTMVRDLPPGSIILFLYAKRIVGDGVVRSCEFPFSEEGYEDYSIRVFFEPRLVRLYPKYVHLDDVADLGEFEAYRRFKGRKSKARGGWPLRTAIPLSEQTYLRILQKTVS
jgi:hypothetical protein